MKSAVGWNMNSKKIHKYTEAFNIASRPKRSNALEKILSNSVQRS